MATILSPSASLESGDRLTREEFHRRYCARPDIAKAELVQGVVYVSSPVRHGVHSKQHGIVILWLGTYATAHPELDVSDNATLYVDSESELQPDAALFRLSSSGGSVRITEHGYLEGVPELIVEVAASSASYDLHDKMEVYRRAGVPEYVVWRVLDKGIDWFDLIDGRYVRRGPDAHGIIESRTFPGLRLDVAAMLGEHRGRVLAALRLIP
ncbi:MAG: Uma2 family endonuclease [Dehalococcoidia bacterium]